MVYAICANIKKNLYMDAIRTSFVQLVVKKDIALIV